MVEAFKRIRAAIALRVKALGGSERLKFRGWRLVLLTFALFFLGLVFSGGFGTLLRVLSYVCAIIMFLRILGWMIRWIFAKVLWTVRSRLIVTGLLMGLAPIILFGTLAGIAAYVFCGQFATSIATEGIKDGLNREQERSAGELMRLSEAGAVTEVSHDGHLIAVWRNGVRFHVSPKQDAAEIAASPLAPGPPPGKIPEWLHPGFKGVTVVAGNLFLCSASGNTVNGQATVLLSCSPFRDAEVAALVEGMGTLSIKSNLLGDGGRRRHKGPKDDDDDDADADSSAKPHAAGPPPPGPPPQGFHGLKGGVMAPAENFFDVPVYFSAPLQTTDFVTGEDDEPWMFVGSRPSLLYRRLFASSVQTGEFVNITLIVVGSLFGLLELIALIMAIGVSRTITRSVGDLYDATQEIDRGNLDYRVPVRRKDQLAALAGSFNRMSGSLKLLLAEQREKDRMQNELKIAQEVQNNLFPHTAIHLPNLEVFGVCEPARTIGGDYYDFIPFGNSQLYLALGDISGKGISAALLMASLHSAVRAYRSAESEEQVDGPDFDANVSPGRLLAMLNRHLYSSTQAAKYATLFLACYNGETRMLTYSNGGHLPPLLLRANGTVERLECGGSVVGLLEGMQYEEATVQLDQGDLLIAYSDGLTEPERDSVDFGEERLIEVVRRNSILPLPDIAARTLLAVQAWIGESEQPDDMTLVLARLS